MRLRQILESFIRSVHPFKTADGKPRDLVRSIVHIVRNGLNIVPWKVRKEVAADLKLIYSAATADEAELRLSEFEDK